MTATHRFLNSFSCCYSKCTRIFSSLCSLKKHILTFHDDSIFHQLDVPVTERDTFQPKLNTQPFSSNISRHIDDVNREPNENSPKNVRNMIELQILKFTSRLYNNNTINRSIVQELLTNTSELVSGIFSNLLAKLNSSSISCSNDIDYKELISILSSDLFLSTNSEYKRFLLMEKHDVLIKPKSFYIGNIFDNKSSSATSSILNIKKCEGQIIPLRIVLQKLLLIPNVLEHMLEYIRTEEANSDHISSLFNSSLWRSIKTKFKGKVILPLYMYYDDFETGNPLGTQAGVHKLGGIYISFAALEQKYASRLENIFLWGLIYSSDKAFFSNAEIFRPFIDELKFLESKGITINGQKIYFVVPLLLGDNLGISSIIGMTESFSSNYFCRACFSHKSATKNMAVEDLNTLRDKYNYDMHLQEKTHGVKDYCVWNDLSYFHNTENIHFDLMHDLYEGVCRYDFGKILKDLIFEKKYFTINILNNRIKYFNHADVDIGNKVPPIPLNHVENELIIMSSAEMHALVTYFPLMIGDLVDTMDETWHFFKLLFNIVHIVSKNRINKSELIYLQCLVNEHHQLYISLFRGHLTPKFHFLTHYSRVINNVGPLSKLSSIRYEAFHKISKSNCNVVSSRVNLPYTLALKHQLKLSYRLLINRGFVDNVEISTYNISPLSMLEIQLYERIIANIEDYFFVKWIKVNGITYKKGLVFQIRRDFFGEPLFALIENIIHNEKQQTYLIYKKIVCYGIDKHYEAYQVEHILPQILAIDLNDVYWPFLTHMHTCGNGNRYISCMNQEL